MVKNTAPSSEVSLLVEEIKERSTLLFQTVGTDESFEGAIKQIAEMKQHLDELSYLLIEIHITTDLKLLKKDSESRVEDFLKVLYPIL